MKKILIFLSIIITLLISSKEYNDIIIPDEAIRIRIIANSNNIEDQMTKNKVKYKIENMLYDKLNKTKNVTEARNIIKNNINEIDNLVAKEVDSKYKIKYGLNYFPEKNLYGIIYKAGNYESLVIELGESKGNNWWCVLFPPLCLIETNKKDLDKIEYKSKIIEILNDYK